MADSRVLLIDDEEDFVTTLAERLQLRGFKTRFTTGGEQGLLLVRSESFDVIVLDLLMPGISGLEVLRQINEYDPHLPVILLTGHGGEREGSDGMRLGAFDYLMKPVDIDALIVKMNEAIEGRPDTGN